MLCARNRASSACAVLLAPLQVLCCFCCRACASGDLVSLRTSLHRLCSFFFPPRREKQKNQMPAINIPIPPPPPPPPLPVTIALQIPGGQRIKASFKSSATLWDVLKHWESQPDRQVRPPENATGGPRHGPAPRRRLPCAHSPFRTSSTVSATATTILRASPWRAAPACRLRCATSTARFVCFPCRRRLGPPACRVFAKQYMPHPGSKAFPRTTPQVRGNAALQTTTLAVLGILSGSALLRWVRTAAVAPFSRDMPCSPCFSSPSFSHAA